MLYDQIERNRRVTVLLFAGFGVILLALSIVIDLLFVGGGWRVAALLAAGLAVLAIVFAWFAADRVILSSMGARPPDLHVREERQAINVVDELAIGAGVPRPRVVIVDDAAPNAFATGRTPDQGVVGFTTGLLSTMDRHELEGVAAHELSHIANRDSMVGTSAAVLVGTVLVVSRLTYRVLVFGGGHRRSNRGQGGGPMVLVAGLIVLIAAGVFAMLLRFAVSRRREALADVSAVRLTHNPDALISALEKLEADHMRVRMRSGLSAHLWIEEPVGDARSSRESWADRLMRTHPPIPERIEALQAVAGELRLREP